VICNSSCMHKFCSLCFEQNIDKNAPRCPECRIRFSKIEVSADVTIRNLVSRLQFRCPNPQCEEVFLCKDRKEHARKCPWKTRKCEFCSATYRLKDEKKHFEQCLNYWKAQHEQKSLEVKKLTREIKILKSRYDDPDEERKIPKIPKETQAKAIHDFIDSRPGTLSIVKGTPLTILEKDIGDGWTKVKVVVSDDSDGACLTDIIKCEEVPTGRHLVRWRIYVPEVEELYWTLLKDSIRLIFKSRDKKFNRKFSTHPSAFYFFDLKAKLLTVKTDSITIAKVNRGSVEIQYLYDSLNCENLAKKSPPVPHCPVFGEVAPHEG